MTRDDETRDEEGEALDREIAADRRELHDRRMRRVLFLPPLLALTVAAWALGASRPREVFAARVWLSAPAGNKLSFRVEVVSAIPGLEGTTPTPNMELRLRDTGGTISKTDENGVAEASLTLDGKTKTDIDAQHGGAWQSIGTLPLGNLLPRDERDGASKLRRTGGARTGALKIDVWPEGSVLAATHPGAVWIRVLDSANAPVAGAAVTVTGDAGISADPPPAMTDASGLARLAVDVTAPPVLLTAKVTHGTDDGKWHGLVGAVVGVPALVGSGWVKTDTRTVELVGSPSWTTVYWDLFQAGARVGGGRVPMTNGRAFVKVPDDVIGATDLFAMSSAVHPSEDDLVHAGTFPLVVEKDAIDAFAAVTTSPRFEDKLTKVGSYESVVAASIAAAPPAIPKLRLAVDGLADSVTREVARGTTVRRAASAAIVGGGLLELGLMIALGVVGRKRTVADELRDLEDDAQPIAKPSRAGSVWTARVLAIVVSSIGLVVLVFAALATMAWGLK